MPLILHNKIAHGGDLAVWKISESTEELTSVLNRHKIYPDIPFFRNQSRLNEWLTARILFAELGVKQRIVYDKYGKPHMEGDNCFVSISHSREFVSVIVNKEHRVGIDVEKTGDRIFKVSHKFVNDREWSWIKEDTKMEQLYVIWGAKECAFKIFGLGSIDFKDNLDVQPFDFKDSGETIVRYHKNEQVQDYHVFYQYLDSLLITYAIAL